MKQYNNDIFFVKKSYTRFTHYVRTFQPNMCELTKNCLPHKIFTV